MDVAWLSICCHQAAGGGSGGIAAGVSACAACLINSNPHFFSCPFAAGIVKPLKSCQRTSLSSPNGALGVSTRPNDSCKRLSTSFADSDFILSKNPKDADTDDGEGEGDGTDDAAVDDSSSNRRSVSAKTVFDAPAATGVVGG
mmetsp:Transcript_18060/g.38954  ORF Transcript_18060/g.38954 Transcript_18060/m.38954 type:complete len:143 (-) Transcript_18060:1532-1960(-)